MPVNKDFYTLAGSSGQSTGYVIANSLRFNDNDSGFLLDAGTDAGDTRKKNTWSVWVKRCTLGSLMYIGAYRYSSTNYQYLSFDSSDRLEFTDVTGGSVQSKVITAREFRDPSAWYHIVCVWDTADGVPGNRARVYVNGVRETSLNTGTYPSQNADSGGAGRADSRLRFGTYDATGNYFDGYLAEVHYTDNYAYDPSNFGEFKEDTDIWIPKEFTGSYGSAGAYLDFETTGTLGANAKGKGNFSLSGVTTHDQMTDTPNNNFAVLNPNDTNNRLEGEIRNGNLELKDNSASQYVYGRATQGFDIEDSGGWYWELLEVVKGSSIGGITDDGDNLGNNGLAFAGAKGITSRGSGGGNTYWKNEDTTYTATNYGVSNGAGNIIQFCAKNGKLFIGVNGTYLQSGNPATEANPQYSGLTGQWFPYVGLYSGASYNTITNFGQDGTFAGQKTAQGNSDANGIGNFFYAPPTGAKALCTRNIFTG